jgi:glyoxylate reductase
MKVFISRPIPVIGIKLLEQAGISVTQWTEKRNLTKEELMIQCQQFDALINVGNNAQKRIDAEFLQACRHLKVISLYSVGYDGVDIAEATRLKIPIGNTPGASNEAVADIAFLLMLAVSRKAFYYHQKIINNQWGFTESTKDLGFELHNKTLGIWGLGRIGFEMAKRCIGAYNMNVIYCNNKVNDQAEKELNAVKVSFDELLAQSDVLSVHVNLTPETQNKFNKNAFKKMKKRSIFINTSRGAIHNETDLIEALEKGDLWGAGLDVTNPEPMLSSNPLLTMPNVAVLPHIGSATEEARNEMAKMAAANTIAGLQNKRIPFPVNPEIY